MQLLSTFNDCCLLYILFVFLSFPLCRRYTLSVSVTLSQSEMISTLFHVLTYFFFVHLSHTFLLIGQLLFLFLHPTAISIQIVLQIVSVPLTKASRTTHILYVDTKTCHFSLRPLYTNLKFQEPILCWLPVKIKYI